MIAVYPAKVCADSTGVLVVLTGPPNRAVTWALTAGAGTLTPITNYTDAQGRAIAKYVPAGVGSAVVSATYGS